MKKQTTDFEFWGRTVRARKGPKAVLVDSSFVGQCPSKAARAIERVGMQRTRHSKGNRGGSVRALTQSRSSVGAQHICSAKLQDIGVCCGRLNYCTVIGFVQSFGWHIPV